MSLSNTSWRKSTCKQPCTICSLILSSAYIFSFLYGRVKIYTKQLSATELNIQLATVTCQKDDIAQLLHVMTTTQNTFDLSALSSANKEMWALRLSWFDSRIKEQSLKYRHDEWQLSSDCFAHFLSTKWKSGEYVDSWVTTFDSSIITTIARGKAVKCTAVKLLRDQRYDGKMHTEKRGYLTEAAATRWS